MQKVFFRFLIPASFVAAALVCAGVMVALRPSAERVDAEVVATPVEVVQVDAQTRPAIVQANGTVTAAQRVSLVPEVAGRITWVSEDLVPGGRFEEGEVVAKIDARDYALAVRQEESRVHQAELELQLEQGRQQVAQREWEILREDRDADEAPLALRKPHLETVKTSVEAAKSGLHRAELALSRTRLKAPFDAVVVDENVDVGQVVGGSPVATFVGTERARVHVAVSVEDLAYLDLAGQGRARVVQKLGNGKGVEREGRILQLGGELDPQTRTASVMVEIDDPMNPEDGLPLLPGAYVDVYLEGVPVDDVFEVPRSAVVDGHYVLVASPQGTLQRRTVEVAWGDERVAAVRGDLEHGEEVITSSIATPIEGMPVQVIEGSLGSADSEDGDDAQSM